MKIKHQGAFNTVISLADEDAKTICRLGQGDKCCAFLTLSADGFECIRMDYPSNTIIFSRLEKGTMNARGKGEWPGCHWHSNKQEE